MLIFDIIPVFRWSGSQDFFESIGERISVIKSAFIGDSLYSIIQPFALFKFMHAI